MKVYSRCSGHASLITNALAYLPYPKRRKIPRFVSSIVTMYGNNGCCFDTSEKRIVYISEEIIPDKGIGDYTLYYKWFVYTVLHECAHAVLKHKPVSEDDPRHARQEKHAQKLAVLWLNHTEREKGHQETSCSNLNEVHGQVKQARKEIRDFIDGKLQPFARPRPIPTVE